VWFTGGQSASLLHADPLAGAQIVVCTTHVASSVQSSLRAHCGEQKRSPWSF
jgi:hypothetical protein